MGISRIFGVTNPRARRLLAATAIVLWFALVFALVSHFLEDALLQPPTFNELHVTEGTLAFHGQCGGKGRLNGFDAALVQAGTSRTVRLPCVDALISLPTGAPLKIHFRQVRPFFSWPAYTELWHATSNGRVLFAYDERVARTNKTRWFGYMLTLLTFVIIVPLSWRLSLAAWREATSPVQK
jgi:hypothetical protein